MFRVTFKRFDFDDKYTIGRILLDGLDTGLVSLEDKVREVDGEPVEKWKIQNETAIPKGIYRAKFTYSPRFSRWLPELQNVPGYTKVRIHPGNSDLDTDGCLLVGDNWGGSDWIGDARVSFGKLVEMMKRKVSLPDMLMKGDTEFEVEVC